MAKQYVMGKNDYIQIKHFKDKTLTLYFILLFSPTFLMTPKWLNFITVHNTADDPGHIFHS